MNIKNNWNFPKWTIENPFMLPHSSDFFFSIFNLRERRRTRKGERRRKKRREGRRRRKRIFRRKKRRITKRISIHMTLIFPFLSFPPFLFWFLHQKIIRRKIFSLHLLQHFHLWFFNMRQCSTAFSAFSFSSFVNKSSTTGELRSWNWADDI
jgi:hypothetical protein